MLAQTQATAANVATLARRSVIAVDTKEDVAALTLDERGMICNCNGAVEALFKCCRSELVWQHVSMLLPQLTGLELMQNGQPNPRLRFLCRIGHHFQAVAQDGERFASELFLNLLDNTGHSRLSLIVRPVEEAAAMTDNESTTPIIEGDKPLNPRTYALSRATFISNPACGRKSC